MSCSSSVSSVLISVAVSILLKSSTVNALPTSIWVFDIDEGPAPPPDQGPPLSAHALRDKSKLKYEIIGIVGAYVFLLLLALVLLLFVGKRLRRKTQTSNRSLSMEILKPAPVASQPRTDVEPPLKSPGKMASLRSWASGGKSHAHKASNVSTSTTIDEKIIEADKARNMDEMAKLYAAVMVHDEQRSQTVGSSGQPSPRSPQYPPQYNTAPPTPRSPHRAPPTPRSPYHQQPQLNGPVSPRSPGYPAEFQYMGPASPKIPKDRLSQALVHPLAPTPVEEPVLTGHHRRRISPLSMIAGRNDSADSGKRRPSRISVRGQPISQPISQPLGSATLTDPSVYSTEGTMSPRIYNPGPPPPTPGQKAGATTSTDAIELEHKGAASLRSVGASTSSNSLPFRQFYNETLKSAPATKTTFVDRRESILGVHPKTGVPQTPYSPYMPFTPMTPITPRTLMSKKEMKANRKKEGLKVLSEDDMVLSDEDMWGK